MALTQTEINEVMSQLQPIIAKALNESTSIQQAQANIQQGVTQYVGARYVPLFADPIEWDSTRAYEPLTIVLHEGNSYTTRQYTPAGIDIANEAFWAETGNYNAQVEQYRQEVARYTDATRVNTKNLQTLSDKTILWVGDSYSDKAFEYSNWLKNCKFYEKIDNIAVSGGGFTSGTTFQTQLNNASGNYNTIVIFGGNNDIREIADTYGTLSESLKNAVINTIRDANSKFGNPNIIIVGPNFDISEITYYPNRVSNFNLTVQTAIKGMTNVTFVSFDCFHIQPAFNNYASATNYHPSSDVSKNYFMTEFFNCLIDKVCLPFLIAQQELTFYEQSQQKQTITIDFINGDISSKGEFKAGINGIPAGRNIVSIPDENPKVPFTLNYLVTSIDNFTRYGYATLTSNSLYSNIEWNLNALIETNTSYKLTLFSATTK